MQLSSNVILTCPRNKCLRLLAYFERKVRASSEISKIIRMQARIPAATRMGTSQISPLSTSKSGAQDEGYHSWWWFWLFFGFFIFLNTLVVLLLISTFLLLFSHSNKSVVHKSSIRSIEAGFKIGLLPNFFTKIGILGGIVDNLRRLLGVEYRLTAVFVVVVLVLGVVVEGFSPFLMKYSIERKRIIH